jgi:hypothetical protein
LRAENVRHDSTSSVEQDSESPEAVKRNHVRVNQFNASQPERNNGVRLMLKPAHGFQCVYSRKTLDHDARLIRSIPYNSKSAHHQQPITASQHCS